MSTHRYVGRVCVLYVQCVFLSPQVALCFSVQEEMGLSQDPKEKRGTRASPFGAWGTEAQFSSRSEGRSQERVGPLPEVVSLEF